MVQGLRNRLSGKDLQQVIQSLKGCPSGLDPILQKTLAFGAAFHHAGEDLWILSIIFFCLHGDLPNFGELARPSTRKERKKRKAHRMSWWNSCIVGWATNPRATPRLGDALAGREFSEGGFYWGSYPSSHTEKRSYQQFLISKTVWSCSRR